MAGIKFYPQLKGLFAEKNQAVHENIGDSESSKHHVAEGGKAKHQEFPFRTKEEKQLAQKYPDQFAIVKKMYFSLDYIDNAQGEYEYQLDGDIQIGKFYVDFKNNQNRSTMIHKQDGKVIETQNILFQNHTVIREMENKNIYYKENVEDDKRKASLVLFNDPVTNSEWYSLIYNNYSQWNYKKGTLNGIPVYLIKGNIPPAISESLSGPFTMVVSVETGALLDLKCFGHSEQPVVSLSTKNIKINDDLDRGVFTLDITNDRQVTKKEFNLSSPGVVITNKDGGE